ncbi:putative bifunctional diguanylate cyclase/phosphodiesterase [Halothiobacillus sp.]|uniref:putative bifunctional diguanylate cyclase/phosphodiesterase n=1 Tax=Halothiobacillus sp. TaxID=1891311 RepID=UPI003D117E3D
MVATRTFQWLDRHERAVRIFMVPFLLILMGMVYALVYETGGIKFVYSHSMYIPILLSGFMFGMRGGLVFGLLGGLILGPFMPINVATHEMQDTSNWLYRTGFFVLIGFLSGMASDGVRSYLRKLRWFSRHDPETKLPNQNALLDKLIEIANEKRDANFLLVIVAMGKAMELKSAFGFNVVDEIIQQSAQRFEKIALGKLSVYRTDMERMALFIELDSGVQVDYLVDKLAAVSRQAFPFRKIPIHADLRMGYVTFRTMEAAPEIYMQQAESALVVAYEQNQDHIAFGPGIRRTVRDNMKTLGEMIHALEAGQLSMYYQPKVNIATGEIHSVEALMRWHHPEHGNIPPDVFIPLAEQSTLIHSITEFALEQAMQQVVEWRQHGIDLPIAVNVSPRNLLHPGFPDLVKQILARHGLQGESLELEVTERALMVDVARAIEVLTDLAATSVSISIDDFGTGFSSLQYLYRLPISYIKIDQSFVRSSLADTRAGHILEAAISLAHKMGIKAIAEGVEDEKVCTLLETLSCDIAQGYLISRPLSADKFKDWYLALEVRFTCHVTK